MSKKFEIFAGLGGGFGGAQSHGIFEYKDKDEALNEAYYKAREEYESYEGSHGILSYEEIREDVIETWGCENWTDDDFWAHYLEEVESWIEYYVEEVIE